MVGASADAVGSGGTMVGKLVSILILSGQW
jgi:hypothetical protein